MDQLGSKNTLAGICKACVILFEIMAIGSIPVSAFSQKEINSVSSGKTDELYLSGAVICEEVSGYAPLNPAIVFSIVRGKVSCFTSFEFIPKEMYILHRWYRRDNLVTTRRLKIKPPRYATFSSIQLRQEDKGPWRVEVTNQSGEILRTLRFSITE